ncbi:MAG: hypothetical protein JSV96_00400 [Candidatus Aminicenantes bacterium]|nr:MAG: hypothetical protein JSV96_00400 [Candidatus Aminicenantes bacterium]
MQDLKGRSILGNEDFKREVLKKLYLNRNAVRRDEDILAKKIIELVVQPPSWHSLKTRKKFKLAILFRNAAIYFLKKYTDLSNQQLSTHFRTLKKSSISQMNRRFNLIKKRYKAIKKISLSLEEEIRKIVENQQKI